jgi:SET domain-containing protein
MTKGINISFSKHLSIGDWPTVSSFSWSMCNGSLISYYTIDVNGLAAGRETRLSVRYFTFSHFSHLYDARNRINPTVACNS